MNLTEHYRLLLGLTKEWTVNDVKLDLVGRRVDIFLAYNGDVTACPVCGEHSPMHDHAPERTWRHLDTMQFETILHASVPRVLCPMHGTKTLSVPWAGPHSRFTLLFEAFAVEVVKACRNIRDASRLLRLDWHTTLALMSRAVERGMRRRDGGEIPWIGMDEKSFRKGQDYVCVMTDIDGERVLDVEPGRSSEVAKALIEKALSPLQQWLVCGVAMDMSAPFEKAVRETMPNADIVTDRFHAEKILSEAVDAVRKREAAILSKRHDERLKRTKYLWLTGLEHLSDENLRRLDDLRRQSLQVSKAWQVKDEFSCFWNRRDKDFARTFFGYWYKGALAVNLRPVRKAAETLKRHLESLLAYYDCFITNAIAEGFNSKIQSIKACARGFRNFQNYRTAILFYCGKLDLSPLTPLPDAGW